MKRIKDFFIPTATNNYKAYLISNKALSFYVVLLSMLNIFFGGVSFTKAYALVSESKVVELHNIERSKNGLEHLKYSSTLSKSARLKGLAMLEADCWSHYCPNGKSPWDFFKEADYKYFYAGENLAEGFTDNETMMNAWMNSKTHRENVLKEEFTEMGVAVVYGDYQGISGNALVVIHFGKPKSEIVQTSSSLGVVDNSMPVVTKPEQNSHVTSDDFSVEGKYTGDVEVEISSPQANQEEQRSGRISPEGGIFTYNPDTESISAEGEYRVAAKDYNNQNLKSDTVVVRVDNTSPGVNNEDLVLRDKISINGDELYKFDFQAQEALASLNVYRGIGDKGQDSLAVLKFNDLIWQLDLTKADVDLGVTVVAEDLAGNKTTGRFNALTLKDTVANSVITVDGDNGSTDRNALTAVWSNLTSSLQKFFSFKITQILSIVIISLLLLLFIVDVLVIQNHPVARLNAARAKTHLHVPGLLVLLILIVIGSVHGTV